jgi:hypothetical protein
MSKTKNGYNNSTKTALAHQRIDDHEKLCRIMQKQTQDQMNKMCAQIKRLESRMMWASSMIITSLIGLIIALLRVQIS